MGARVGVADLPLKQHLEAAFDLPVFVENEVNLLAVGEAGRRGRGIRRLVCVSVGTGVARA